MNRFLILFIFFIGPTSGDAQLNGIFKIGLNIGTVNQEWWVVNEPLYKDSIRYEKALLRPIISGGAQYWLSQKFYLQQEIMYQVKGQGTSTPKVRSGYRYSDPDVLRMMSFPLSINGRLLPNVFLGLSIQPSLYLSGTDNYSAKEVWHGWIWSSSVSLKYQRSTWEIGVEYDHDFTEYYCPGCEIRFFTLRAYGAYRFQGDDQ